MNRPKSTLTINIKGRDWVFNLVPDKTFDKLYNPADEGHTAMTLPNQYKVDFRKSDWCFDDIIHELGHVLKHMSETHTADLNTTQMEELMCQIVAKNYFQIGYWAGLVAEKFFGRE